MGIGNKGTLPWKLPKEMAYFKQLTVSTQDPLKRNVVLMGRKTWESIPPKFRPLPDRLNVVLSSNPQSVDIGEAAPSKVQVFAALSDALEFLGSSKNANKFENIFVIGGATLYDEVISAGLADEIYLTKVLSEFECDTFVQNLDAAQWNQVWTSEVQQEQAADETVRYQFTRLKNTHRPSLHPEQQYLDLIREILHDGISKGDRTGTGTRSVFGRTMRFSLRDSFPLLTTKKVFWRGVAEELLWFISGKTDARLLQEKKIKIWDGNSSREYLDSIGLTDRAEGDLGPVYGFQWRHFGAEYSTREEDYTGKGIDQLSELIEKIKTNPNDRRLLMSAWNPKDMKLMALPPCHVMCQFYVANGELSCQMYQRSCDMGLGVPFNIASYALLTVLVAHVCNLKPGDFVHVLGDAHVYNNHIDALEEQLRNQPRSFPKLSIKRKVTSIDDFTFDDLVLEDYQPHDTIKMKMAV
jgi:dihydrofolate reductase/thymidylate synthase